MGTARQVRESLQKMQAGIIEIAGECMLEKKEQIVGLLVHQQYEENVDSKGNPLRQYTPFYKHWKAKETGRGDKTDFNLTGEFQQEMNLTIDGEYYIIDSPATTNNGVLKSAWLNKWQEDKGGANVMSLTEENKALIWPIIEEPFKEKCNARLAID